MRTPACWLTIGLLFSQVSAFGQLELYKNPIDRNACVKNKISAIKVYEHFYIDSASKKELLFHWIYNRRGLCIESFSYSSSYLEEASPIKVKIEEPYHEKFKYDKSDSMITHIGYIQTIPVPKNFTYRVNEENAVIEMSDGFDTWEYDYDTRKRIAQEKWYLSPEKMPFRLEKYEYDESNKLINRTVYNSDKTIFCYEINKYDSASRKIKTEQYRDSSLCITWEYIYDSQGNLTETKYTELREPRNSTWNKYVLDDKGLIKEETGKYSGIDKEFKRTYEYEHYK